MKSCNNKDINVKVLITYKEKHKLFKSDILMPIQTGRAIADEIFEDMIGDDTGDNISERNHKYNELSAQYWAWKNYDKLGNPEYIGFMHYRRHFIFDDTNLDELPKSYLNQCEFDYADDKYLKHISDENIIKSLRQNDCIVPTVFDVQTLNKKNVREQFGNVPKQKVEHFDTMVTIAKVLQPEYTKEIQDFITGTKQYICNMFVLPKKLFFKYCEFCFPILFEVEKQIEIDETNYLSSRVLGYFGEMLFSIFMFKEKKNNLLRIKELGISIVKDTLYEEELKPVFSDCKNAIAMGCSNLYAPYLSVYLKSIYNNSDPSQKYDIVIFENDISKITKQKLLEMTRPHNISLRFYNVDYLFSKYQLPVSATHFAKQCYYRLGCGLIFKNYKKVLYTDIDLIANFNINDLFKIDLKGYPIAAPIEISLTDDVILEYQRKYLEENFDENISYCNTGIMIIDIEKFNQITTFDNLIQESLEKTYRWQEQCVINKVFAGKITPLNSEYNFEIYDFIYNNFHPTYIKYMKGVDKAKIYHFLAMRKVWFYPETLKGYIWWQYARQTPFYEEILARLIDFRISQKDPQTDGNVAQLRQEFVNIHFPNINNHFAKNEKDMKLLFVMAHPVKFRLKKWCYGIKKAFAFGKRHKKYQNKFNAVKQLIKEAKIYEKQLAGI